MTTTTIKVSRDVRDRLKEQASMADRTLGEHLAHLADLEDRARRFDVLSAAIAATPPEVMREYMNESRYWGSIENE